MIVTQDKINQCIKEDLVNQMGQNKKQIYQDSGASDIIKFAGERQKEWRG